MSKPHDALSERLGRMIAVHDGFVPLGVPVRPVIGDRGEMPDFLALVKQPGQWCDAKLYPGDMHVYETKLSVSDVTADFKKPWRQPDVYACGRLRSLLTPEGLLPEWHCDPENTDSPHRGWGHYETADDDSFRMIRQSEVFHKVDNCREKMLLAKLGGLIGQASGNPGSQRIAVNDEHLHILDVVREEGEVRAHVAIRMCDAHLKPSALIKAVREGKLPGVSVTDNNLLIYSEGDAA